MSPEAISPSRRQVLRGGAALATTAGLATAAGTASATEVERPGISARVAVVGAGLAGLHAADLLRQAGADVTVYEASNRVGGRVASFTDPASGLVYDAGGAFVNTDHKDMRALARRFNLDLFDLIKDSEALSNSLGTPITGYYLAGSLRTEAEVAEQLGPLADQILADADRLFADYDTVAPEFDVLSVADYLDQHIGLVPDPAARPWVRSLLTSSIRSEYGAEPPDSSALQLLFLLPSAANGEVELLGSSDERFVVVGGTDQITDGLAAALAGRIELGRTLHTICGSDAQGYTLRFTSGPAVTADYVVVAVPASRLRDITFDIALPPLARDYLGGVDLGRNEKTFLEVTDKVWRTDTFIGQVWTDLGCCVAWDGTQRQPDAELGAVTVYTGGAEPLPDDSDAAGQAQLDRLAQVVPGVRDASTGGFQRTRWSDSPHIGGAYSNFRPGQLTAFADFFWIEGPGGQSVNVGNVVLAGEHTSDAWYGFMEGAAQTGRLAAELVVSRARA